MIYAFTGLPGGGKSLTSLADFVIPELMRGRHVFCNIVGLVPLLVGWKISSSDKIFTTSYVNRYLHRFSMSFDDEHAAASKEFRKCLPGGIVHYANAEGLSLLIDDVLSFNVVGEEPVVIIDECHEYFNSANWKYLRPFSRYISMARHYGHDLILITQHVTDVWDPLLKRVHETHDFVRGQLGFRTQYKEIVYHGSNILQTPAYTRKRFNDKSLYSVYKSREKGAKEHMGYISIWQNRKFLFLLFTPIVLLLVGFFFLSDGLFPDAQKKSSPPPSSPVSVDSPAPEFSQNTNVIYVKYVVCGSFDCKATRPDGSVLTLPLDYNSGKYPIEVRKYVQASAGPPSFSFPGSRPGMPNQAR